MKSLLKQTSQSQSSYHKPSYKCYGNKQQYSGHKSYNKSQHNKGKYRHNTRINEFGEYSSDASSCSDQSDAGEEFDQQEPPTSDNSKKLATPLKIAIVCLILWEGTLQFHI